MPVKVTDSGAEKLRRPVLFLIETRCCPPMYRVRESLEDLGSTQIRRGGSGRASCRFHISPQSRETKSAGWFFSPAAAYRTLEFAGSIANAEIRPKGSALVTRSSSA